MVAKPGGLFMRIKPKGCFWTLWIFKTTDKVWWLGIPSEAMFSLLKLTMAEIPGKNGQKNNLSLIPVKLFLQPVAAISGYSMIISFSLQAVD